MDSYLNVDSKHQDSVSDVRLYDVKVSSNDHGQFHLQMDTEDLD